MPNRRIFRVLGENPMAAVGQILNIRPYRNMNRRRFFALGDALLTIGDGENVTLENDRQKQSIYFCFVNSLPAPPTDRDFTTETHLAFTKGKGKQVLVHEYTTKGEGKLVLAEIEEGEDGGCELATCNSQFVEVDAAAFTDRALAISGIPAIFPGFACTASDMAAH